MRSAAHALVSWSDVAVLLLASRFPECLQLVRCLLVLVMIATSKWNKMSLFVCLFVRNTRLWAKYKAVFDRFDHSKRGVTSFRGSAFVNTVRSDRFATLNAPLMGVLIVWLPFRFPTLTVSILYFWVLGCRVGVNHRALISKQCSFGAPKHFSWYDWILCSK